MVTPKCGFCERKNPVEYKALSVVTPIKGGAVLAVCKGCGAVLGVASRA